MRDSLLSAHGEFSVPRPQTWPPEAVRAFEQVTGRRSLFDVFLFDHQNAAAMYFEDAITALAVLPITREEWFTHCGYPVVVFDPWKIQQYSQGLAVAGYRVVILEKSARPRPEGNSKVVSIASARGVPSRRRHKWA